MYKPFGFSIVLFFSLIFPVSSFGSPLHPAKVQAMESISWLNGSWISFEGNNSIEEHWSFSNGSFVGMFREMKEGKSAFFEVMAIEAGENDIEMRIRHFGPGLKTAWEEKNNPMTFKLGEHSKTSAIFNGVNAQAGERLLYRLIDKKTLEITGEFLHEGKKTIEKFKMNRKTDLKMP